MGYSDNPAGRLHTLLTAYSSEPNLAMEAGWAAAIGVDRTDVVLHIGRVANLLNEVRTAYEEVGEEDYSPILGHLQSLSRCLWPIDEPFANPVSRNMPDQTAMEYLRTFDIFLHRFSPEGPGAADLDEAVSASDLSVEIGDLISSVAASDLDPRIKRMMLNRLNGMLQAVQFLRVGGPDAVRQASESLRLFSELWDGAVAEKNKPLFERAKAVAAHGYAVVKVVGVLAASSHAAQLEAAGIERAFEQPSPPALSTGAEPEHEAHLVDVSSEEEPVDAEVVEDDDGLSAGG